MDEPTAIHQVFDVTSFGCDLGWGIFGVFLLRSHVVQKKAWKVRECWGKTTAESGSFLKELVFVHPDSTNICCFFQITCGSLEGFI